MTCLLTVHSEQGKHAYPNTLNDKLADYKSYFILTGKKAPFQLRVQWRYSNVSETWSDLHQISELEVQSGHALQHVELEWRGEEFTEVHFNPTDGTHYSDSSFRTKPTMTSFTLTNNAYGSQSESLSCLEGK